MAKAKGKTKAKALTAKEVIERLADRSGHPKKTVYEVLEHMADLAHEEAKNGFKLHGLGKLILVDRAARIGRNPKTGETIEIPAKKVVKFRVAKACKDAILNG